MNAQLCMDRFVKSYVHDAVVDDFESFLGGGDGDADIVVVTNSAELLLHNNKSLAPASSSISCSVPSLRLLLLRAPVNHLMSPLRCLCLSSDGADAVASSTGAVVVDADFRCRSGVLVCCWSSSTPSTMASRVVLPGLVPRNVDGLGGERDNTVGRCPTDCELRWRAEMTRDRCACWCALPISLRLCARDLTFFR